MSIRYASYCFIKLLLSPDYSTMGGNLFQQGISCAPRRYASVCDLVLLILSTFPVGFVYSSHSGVTDEIFSRILLL